MNTYYQIQDTETKNVITVCDSKEEAESLIEEYENEDFANGDQVEGLYEIVKITI